MDNRLLNINGLGRPMLQAALQIATHQHRGCYGDGEQDWGIKKTHTFASWMKHPTAGLILGWHASDGLVALPGNLGPEGVMPFVWEYLQSDEASDCLLAAIAAEPKSPARSPGPASTQWTREFRGEADSKAGWQVYTEAWGHVAGNHYAICAVRKAYLWYGK